MAYIPAYILLGNLWGKFTQDVAGRRQLWHDLLLLNIFYINGDELWIIVINEHNWHRANFHLSFGNTNYDLQIHLTLNLGQIQMLDEKYLRSVMLPPDLSSEEIYLAMKNTEEFFAMIRRDAGITLSEIIQANNFSGIVSNVFTKKLSDISRYHSYHDQRYPDLMYYEKNVGLEVKASNKAWKGGEGHNGHTGWHIIVCYNILNAGDIEFIHAEIANLNGFETSNSDWKYQGSKRNNNNSQRTETYITTAIGTAKLRDGSVYLNTEIAPITAQMTKNRNALATALPVPPYSPFFYE